MELQASQLLLDGLTAAARSRLSKMNPQNVANSLWVWSVFWTRPQPSLIARSYIPAGGFAALQQ